MACWEGYKQVGMKKKGNKMVPNCVPKNEEVEEGRKKNWYWRRNRYWDKVILGITKDLYFDLVSSNSYWS